MSRISTVLSSTKNITQTQCRHSRADQHRRRARPALHRIVLPAGSAMSRTAHSLRSSSADCLTRLLSTVSRLLDTVLTGSHERPTHRWLQRRTAGPRPHARTPSSLSAAFDSRGPRRPELPHSTHASSAARRPSPAPPSPHPSPASQPARGCHPCAQAGAGGTPSTPLQNAPRVPQPPPSREGETPEQGRASRRGLVSAARLSSPSSRRQRPGWRARPRGPPPNPPDGRRGTCARDTASYPRV